MANTWYFLAVLDLLQMNLVMSTLLVILVVDLSLFLIKLLNLLILVFLLRGLFKFQQVILLNYRLLHLMHQQLNQQMFVYSLQGTWSMDQDTTLTSPNRPLTMTLLMQICQVINILKSIFQLVLLLRSRPD